MKMKITKNKEGTLTGNAGRYVFIAYVGVDDKIYTYVFDNRLEHYVQPTDEMKPYFDKLIAEL